MRAASKSLADSTEVHRFIEYTVAVCTSLTFWAPQHLNTTARYREGLKTSETLAMVRIAGKTRLCYTGR